MIMIMLTMMTIKLAKVLATCLLLTVAMMPSSTVYGSSIPIWEFLTRNEKISYLYSTFAQLVSTHCKATAAVTTSLPVNQCKHDLLNYGFEKLQSFANNQLDNMDPYQRGANEIIWSVIMREHPDSTLISTRKPASELLDNRENPIGVNNANQSPNTVAITDGYNPVFDNDGNQNKHNQYELDIDMDTSYGYQQMKTSRTPYKTYLTGPLVVRVKPDGTPVDEDIYKPIPKDDDLEILSGNDDSIIQPQMQATSLSTDGKKEQNLYVKHRKVATISLLKDTPLASLASMTRYKRYYGAT